jgi:hypothetical protein
MGLLRRNTHLPIRHDTYLKHALACMALQGVVLHGGNGHPMEAESMVRHRDVRDELWPSVAWTSGVDHHTRFYIFVDVDVDEEHLAPADVRRIARVTLRGIADELRAQMPDQVKGFQFGRITEICEVLQDSPSA